MKTALLAPCGEGALRVTALHNDAAEQWRFVHALAEWMREHPIDGVYSCVPTYDSMLIEFDPVRVTAGSLAPVVEAAMEHSADFPSHEPKRFVLPVVYGGEYGPDLGFTAEHLGITEDDVIALHTGADRVVRCLGGPAASCMIDGPEFSAPIPRLPDPRLQVPPNAISVAGRQGVIGPVRAPSGWRLIGLTPVEIMDMTHENLIPYRPGDLVRFRAIDASEWRDYEGMFLHQMEEAC
ncbi:5-oxoprolinase subunit B family protein [Microbacterium sp. YY-01]|uniref:5-oxoprolinase subunit B family protein n=1 Tax=Microbacterium sp. YY-01 TaxID=3421634 RepID=UPI003D178D22